MTALSMHELCHCHQLQPAIVCLGSKLTTTSPVALAGGYWLGMPEPSSARPLGMLQVTLQTSSETPGRHSHTAGP